MQEFKKIEAFICSKQAHFLIALLGVFFCLFMITAGSFDFFMGGELPLMYNYMFLSLLEGRTDVPYQAVGLEGFYREDGLVFAYFGYFPALMRAFFYPFVDLKTVSVSRATIVIPLILAGLLAHYLVYFIAAKVGANEDASKRLCIVLGALAIWFCSPITFLVANSIAYHEAFAYSFFIMIVYFYIVARYLLFSEDKKFFAFLMLALLSGCLLHLRPHVALIMYTSTCFTMLYFLIKPKPTVAGFVFDGVRYCSVPFIIMFVSGILFLYVNYIRWGDMFTTINFERMGYVLFVEGMSDRFKSFVQMGPFHIRRFIPNALYHHFAFPDIHALLADILNAGKIRLEAPKASSVYMWAFWYIIMFLIVPKSWLGKITWNKYNFLFLNLAISTALIFIAINCFGTVTLRYKTELWYLLFLGFLFYLSFKNKEGNQKSENTLLVIFLLVSVVSTGLIVHDYRTFLFPDTKGFYYPDFSIYGPVIPEILHQADYDKLIHNAQ
ncbi:MAG: hypothetical protein GC137_04030 [Alphaproteobacteria bacterium]|nr:hypothetical protein [Alphaproteobacteria bacterium]